MCKSYCEELIERLVRYVISISMYDSIYINPDECRKEIKEIMEEFEEEKENLPEIAAYVRWEINKMKEEFENEKTKEES